MPEIGEPFIRITSLASNGFVEFNADSGEKWKVVMVYAKQQAGESSPGEPFNADLNLSPANGDESNQFSGLRSTKEGYSTIGSNDSNGSSDVAGLQPVFVDDTTGLYIGNNGVEDIDVIIQGVRVA